MERLKRQRQEVLLDERGQLELFVVQELFMTETAKMAHVVLPGASFLEKSGTFTNGERRIQRVRQVLPPDPGARPDWQILLDLMRATGLPSTSRCPAAAAVRVSASPSRSCCFHSACRGR